MTPPIVPQGTDSASCTDLTPVDLTPFKDFPDLKNIPAANLVYPELRANLKTANLYLNIDDKKKGLGNGNGLLEKDELDQFIANNRKIFGPETTACMLLQEARLLAAQAPQIKIKLGQAPDLTPVELAPLKALPYLDEFVKLPKVINSMDEFKALLAKTSIPKELQEAIVQSEKIQTAYISARMLVESDVDPKDGKLSVEDLKKLFEQNPDASQASKNDPALILAQARIQIPVLALQGKQIQAALRLPSDPQTIDVNLVKGYVELAPKFFDADPDLKYLLEVIGNKNEKGQIVLVPDATDGYFTLEEFKKNNVVQSKVMGGAGSAEAQFAKIKAVLGLLEQPLYLWPNDLQEKLKNSGEDAYKNISSLQQLTLDQSRAELVLQFVQQTSDGKFEQNKVDHAGPAGNSYMAKLVGYIVFGEPWNKHFQETRPQASKEERDAAIETLRKTMRERSQLNKVEDALTYLENNGNEKEAKILKEDCDIERWIKTANINEDVERYKALAKLSGDYRKGHWPGFWDFNLIPTPRLGSGGWWDRAVHLDNWSWGKESDAIVSLGIDNYLGTEIPNTYRADHEGRSLMLVGQLSEADRKSFGEMMEKAAKGELSDTKTAETLLEKATLTKEGREDLLSRLRLAIQGGENVKLYKEVSALPFLKDLKQEDEKLQKLNTIFSSVTGGAVKAQAIEGQLEMLEFSKEDTQTLQTYLRRVQVLLPLPEDKGIDTLFHEAQLGDQEARARELFQKENPTDPEKVEFKSILAKGKLSDENRQVLEFGFDHQLENRIAEAAKNEFMDILGYPQKGMILKDDKMTQDWDPKSVGNLHNSIRTTVDRGVGLGMILAPTAAGGGIGYSLAKSDPRWGLFGGAVIGGGIGFTASDDNKVRNAFFGAGVGGATAYGFSRLFKVKNLNPWWGAAAVAALGTMFTISPYGENLRNMGWEIMKTPYRPWSDFSVADMPAEGLGIYVDFAVGTKAMTGVMDGVRLFGALEMGSRILALPGVSRISPWLLRRKLTTSLMGAGLGGLSGYDLSSKKDGATIFRDVSMGAVGGFSFTYGMLTNKLWTVTGAGAIGGGTFMYMNTDHKDVPKTIRNTVLGALAVGGMVFFLGKGLKVSMEKPTGLDAEIMRKTTPLTVEEVQALQAQGKLKWLSPWAEQQYKQTLQQIEAGEAMNMSAERLEAMKRLAASYAKVGMEGAFPRYSSRILSYAMKHAEAETAEGLEQSQKTIMQGAADLQMMEKGTLTNDKLAKVMLIGAFADKVDGKVKPGTPLIPKFNENFNGVPRPAQAAAKWQE
jgi:hypothetical protein